MSNFEFRILSAVSVAESIFEFLILKYDGHVKSQNLTQRHNGRKSNILISCAIFLAFLASLRENIVFTISSSMVKSNLKIYFYRSARDIEPKGNGN
jgi:hypothetical protein